MQNKLTTLINLSLELQRLNNSFGFLSCFDYPKEYNRMDELQTEIGAIEKALTDDNDISVDGLSTAIENIASDITSGNIPNGSTFTLLSQDEFIERLADPLTRKEAERFKDMLAWMQEKDRAGYLETRFILELENDSAHKKQYYYDKRFSFVIVVE